MNRQSDHIIWAALRQCAAVLMCSHPALGQPSVKWLSIAGHAEFADAQSQLQVLVDMNGHAVMNRICVVGQQADRYLQAYVYWPAENKLILWIPINGDPQSIVDSKRYLDLTRDVVKDEASNSSTYMITRSEADKTIRECGLHGVTYVIQKAAASQHHG